MARRTPPRRLRLYRISLAHPHVVPLLATRLLAVPLARRPLAVLQAHERVLALLDRAGLDAQGVVTAYRAVTAWVLGYIFSDLRAMVDNPDEPDPAFRLGLHLMPPASSPAARDRAHPGREGRLPGADGRPRRPPRPRPGRVRRPRGPAGGHPPAGEGPGRTPGP
ncbi:hypothetical protein O1L60_05800 [Streptomyces diastatochromogenes]|nr:hypothetical protein [Streptomyces diastatochromogenes]